MIRIKSYSATGSSVADHHYDSCVMLAEDMSKFVVQMSYPGGVSADDVFNFCCAKTCTTVTRVVLITMYESCAVQMTSTNIVLCR